MSAQLAPLRVVTFNVLPLAYTMVSQWAAQGGHQIVLVVTSPGPPSSIVLGFGLTFTLGRTVRRCSVHFSANASGDIWL